MAPLFSSIFVFSLLCIVFFVQAHEEQSTTFTYEGPLGPTNWGSLSPKCSACSNGKSQSPIDIVKQYTELSKHPQTLVKTYTATSATLINNGFNIGVHFREGSGAATIDGKSYTLKQMHWHCPSEHRLHGEQFAAELHLVHQADDGSLSVIGILLQYGDSDPLLAQVQDKLAELANEKSGSKRDVHIALGDLEPKHMTKSTHNYYRYIGSLTTPPCTENVMWNILDTVRTISKEQVEALKAPLAPAYKNNARPVQPLNGRKIVK